MPSSIRLEFYLIGRAGTKLKSRTTGYVLLTFHLVPWTKIDTQEVVEDATAL
jgi:hypothetical protein